MLPKHLTSIIGSISLVASPTNYSKAGSIKLMARKPMIRNLLERKKIRKRKRRKNKRKYKRKNKRKHKKKNLIHLQMMPQLNQQHQLPQKPKLNNQRRKRNQQQNQSSSSRSKYTTKKQT